MNKKTIITLLFVLVAVAGLGKTFKTIKTPDMMACVNVNRGELKAREVVMRDTVTTIHFTMEYEKGRNFRFSKGCYLKDEDGNRYPLRSAEGITLDAWVQSPESGVTDFTMHFEPMPKDVEVFDFIEGDGSGAFKLLGIHDKTIKLTIPTIQELIAANPYTLPQDWFKTDTITVKGRIEDYDAERFGFTSMECYFNDVIEKDDATLLLDIADDGSFCKKFQANYPVRQSFFTRESKVGFDHIAFFARPGETIDITVRKDDSGRYRCIYNNGSSREVERWLRTSDDYDDIILSLGFCKGKFAEANEQADKIWNNTMYRLQTVSRREHYTPMEIQLALADVQASYTLAYMGYTLGHLMDLTKQEYQDSAYYAEILDTIECALLFDEKQYTPLHRVDFDNPLLMMSSNYPSALDCLHSAYPVSNRRENAREDDSTDGETKGLAEELAALRDLMGDDKDNLTIQLCVYKDYISDFNSWRQSKEPPSDIIYNACLATITHPYIRHKAVSFRISKMRNQ